MSWNYRVVRRTHDGEVQFGIHEAYDNGASWTEEPVAPTADSLDDLRDVLAKMTDAIGSPVIDAERARRVDLVVEKATALVGYRENAAAPLAWRELHRAVELLRECTSVEVAAPEPNKSLTPAAIRARVELHELAPLPWRQVQGRDVRDANARHLFMVSAADSTPQTDRVMELLVQLVNDPPAAAMPPLTVLRAEAAVIEAARAHAKYANERISFPVETLRDLMDAVAALDALVGKSDA